MTSGSLVGTQNVTVNGNVAGTSGIINLTGGTFEQRVAANKNFGTTSGSSAWTFNGLKFSNSSGSTSTVTTQTSGSGGLTVTDTLTVGSGSDSASTGLSAGNRTWTFTNAAGATATPFTLVPTKGGFSASTSTLVFTGNYTGGNTVTPSTGYYNLTFNNASETFEPSTSLSVRDLTISAGTLDMTTGNYALNASGDITNNGVFNARAGTVYLGGSSQQNVYGTWTGSSSFYDLFAFNTSGASPSDCERTGFTPSIIFNSDITASGTFTIPIGDVRIQYNSGSTYAFNNISWNGQSSGSRIYFRNSATSGTWLLNVTAIGSAQTKVSYVNVSRSDASSGAQIIASDGTNVDCNNNTNWMFAESLILSLDATSKNFGTLTPGGTPVDQTTTLTASTNANTGYTVYAWATQLFSSGGNTIANWTGTNETPTIFNSNTGSFFGYSTDDSNLGCPVGVPSCTANRFTSGSANFAGFGNVGPGASSGDPVADSTGPATNAQTNVKYRLTASTGQAAGQYDTTVIYVITAKFP